MNSQQCGGGGAGLRARIRSWNQNVGSSDSLYTDSASAQEYYGIHYNLYTHSTVSVAVLL